MQEVLERAGVVVSLVVETHRHKDYVTGGYGLAQATGARYVVPADDLLARRLRRASRPVTRPTDHTHPGDR